MSKIRSRDTDIELALKEALERNQIPFEYQPQLLGRPDFLIPPSIAVFCDSSFWHGRNWNELDRTLSKGYWHEHIKRNRERDVLVTSQLTSKGFIVLRFWDYQIKKEIAACIDKIKIAINMHASVCDKDST